MDHNNFQITYNPEEPLQNKVFENTMHYNDLKQDSRTDELLNTLDKILFWIRIIGLYFLVKITIAILTFIIAGQTIKELIVNIL